MRQSYDSRRCMATGKLKCFRDAPSHFRPTMTPREMLPDELVQQLASLMALAFTGSTTATPEPSTHWYLGPQLQELGSSERDAVSRHVINLAMAVNMPTGTILGVRAPDGALPAGHDGGNVLHLLPCVAGKASQRWAFANQSGGQISSGAPPTTRPRGPRSPAPRGAEPSCQRSWSKRASVPVLGTTRTTSLASERSSTVMESPQGQMVLSSTMEMVLTFRPQLMPV